ncbi:MAG: hypothetical protein HYX53_03815 [Chloroflexi bacterium]|nr:hypothetical protein [Chloroflexota bacterium]
MGLKQALGRVAAGAPVPVFAVAGQGAREHVQDLRLDGRLRLVDSPGAAMVLLIAGGLPDGLAEPLAHLHDSLPHPRATLWWPLGAGPATWPQQFVPTIETRDGVSETLQAIQRELLRGQRPGEPPILPDEDPVPWKGVGPYGQGGTGMTGGTPYGRPMAELGADRDGLRLDVLPLRIGPFFPRFPPGLTLDLKLAGDVIVDVAPVESPFAGAPPVGVCRAGARIFVDALSQPVPVAGLELARAREHLRWLADALVAVELGSLGSRVLRLAAELRTSDGDSIRTLGRALRRTQAIGWATNGVGRIPAAAVEGLGAGPIARAAGLPEDERTHDPAYSGLGFEPIVQRDGDAAARWRQRLGEAAQSLELAARAGDRRTVPTGSVESPRGRLDGEGNATARFLHLLPGVLQGLEWGDAVTTLVSLDLDFEEAVFAETARAGAVAS